MATRIPAPPVGSSGAESVKRRYATCAYAIHTTAASSDVLDIRDFREVAFKPPAGVTAILIEAAETADGTFVPVDNIGTNGSMTVVAAKWNTLDTAKIGPFGFIRLAATGGTGTGAVVAKT